MQFPNPFKNLLRKSKDVHELIEETKGGKKKSASPAAPVPTEKVTGFFRGMRQRRVDVTALAKQFDSIGNLPDPSERLLLYKEIQDTCNGMLAQATGGSVLPALGTGLGGIAMLFAGASTFNPLLFAGGIFTAGAGAGMLSKGSKPKKWTMSPALNKDRQSLVVLAVKTREAIEEIVVREALVNIAKSPHFDEVTVAFPALKDRFLAAAAKEKIIQDSRPSQPKQDKPHDGGNRRN